MAIELAEIAQRSRISGVHYMGLGVQRFSGLVLLIHFGGKSMLHHAFNVRALRTIHDWSVKYIARFDAELLQLLRCLFRLAGEKALLLHHCFEERDCAFFVPGL